MDRFQGNSTDLFLMFSYTKIYNHNVQRTKVPFVMTLLIIFRSSSTDGCMGSLSNLFIFSEDTNEDREIADMDLDASCSLYNSSVQDMIDRPPAPSGAMFTLGHQDSYCGSESCDSFIWTQSHGKNSNNLVNQ